VKGEKPGSRPARARKWPGLLRAASQRCRLLMLPCCARAPLMRPQRVRPGKTREVEGQRESRGRAHRVPGAISS